MRSIRIGRNHRCPCGSGQKYKRCHGRPDSPSGFKRAVDLTSLTLRERWGLLAHEIHSILGLPRKYMPSDVRAAFAREHALEINRAYDHIFNDFVDPFQLPKAGDGLSVVYMGDIQEKLIRRNILRMSLYADNIYVADPFHNPRMSAPGLETALRNPDAYIFPTYQSAYFLLRMAPWIEAGIVTPLVNPSHVDMDYRRETLQSLSKLRESLSGDEFDAEVHAHLSDMDHYTEIFSGVPTEHLLTNIKQLLNPIPHGAALELYNHILDDRLNRLDIPPPSAMDGARSQLLLKRGGFDAITCAIISARLNAFPFSESQTQLKLIDSLYDQGESLSGEWSPIAQCFSKTPISFLNDIDPDFAISLRRDGRLSSFRSMLRRVWKAAAAGDNPNNATALAFADQIVGEYEAAYAEWQAIKLEALKWGLGSTGAILTGTLTFNLPTLLAAGGGLVSAYQHWSKGKQFRLRNPASIFVDLRNKSRIR